MKPSPSAVPEPPESQSARPVRGLALVVDDDPANRKLLDILLASLGFSVIQAENGREAVTRFTESQPDIVFMDVMMPEMDGFAACRQIKAQCTDRLVPVVFLSALDDEASMIEAMEAGGDDFLTKPYNHAVLKARIESMMRSAGLYREAASLYTELRQDEAVAEKLHREAITTGNLDTDQIRVINASLGVFQTDIFLSARTPNNDIHLMLGDFSGHRLTATMAALPVVQQFRSLSNQGFSLKHIINSVNAKLNELFAGEIGLAAQFVRIGSDLSFCEIANLGMPPLYVLESGSGRIRARVDSVCGPLGRLPCAECARKAEYVALTQGDRILLASDGVTEAVSLSGERFGVAGVERLLAGHDGEAALTEHLYQGLQRFTDDMMAVDDISLVEVTCTQALVEPPPQRSVPAGFRSAPAMNVADKVCDCEFEWTVRGAQLAVLDPLPYVMQQLDQIEGFDQRRNQFFTVLTELYVNALDHGVLELDSALKYSADGFAEYFARRERRLAEIQTGYIRLQVHVFVAPEGRCVRITVTDSGAGYDPDHMMRGRSVYAGRGLTLVRELTQAMQVNPPGNEVTVTFAW